MWKMPYQHEKKHRTCEEGRLYKRQNRGQTKNSTKRKECIRKSFLRQEGNKRRWKGKIDPATIQKERINNDIYIKKMEPSHYLLITF